MPRVEVEQLARVGRRHDRRDMSRQQLLQGPELSAGNAEPEVLRGWIPRRPHVPGQANAFYERAISQHLRIGIETLDLLRNEGDGLHSRKLRSFDEPPLR